MNRNEKIKFLYGLQKGEKNIQELRNAFDLTKCTTEELNFLLSIKRSFENGIMPANEDIVHIGNLQKEVIHRK